SLTCSARPLRRRSPISSTTSGLARTFLGQSRPIFRVPRWIRPASPTTNQIVTVCGRPVRRPRVVIRHVLRSFSDSSLFCQWIIGSRSTTPYPSESVFELAEEWHRASLNVGRYRLPLVVSRAAALCELLQVQYLVELGGRHQLLVEDHLADRRIACDRLLVDGRRLVVADDRRHRGHELAGELGVLRAALDVGLDAAHAFIGEHAARRGGELD